MMTAVLWTIKIDHCGTKNAHDASMVQYGDCFIQGGSATSSYDCSLGQFVGQSYCISCES